jgi:hypothetical protein
MSSGEERAWNVLRALNPDDVCRNAAVEYDNAAGIYLLKSFGMDISIDPEKNTIYSSAPEAGLLLDRLGYFSRLSILIYLTSAKDIPLSGKLVQPANLRGGHIFFRGTHVLPLDNCFKNTARIPEISEGERPGGKELKYGDASVQLFPFQIPVVAFSGRGRRISPRVDLLFDSACESHLALDILVCAMMSLLIMVTKISLVIFAFNALITFQLSLLD